MIALPLEPGLVSSGRVGNHHLLLVGFDGQSEGHALDGSGRDVNALLCKSAKARGLRLHVIGSRRKAGKGKVAHPVRGDRDRRAPGRDAVTVAWGMTAPVGSATVSGDGCPETWDWLFARSRSAKPAIKKVTSQNWGTNRRKKSFIGGESSCRAARPTSCPVQNQFFECKGKYKNCDAKVRDRILHNRKKAARLYDGAATRNRSM